MGQIFQRTYEHKAKDGTTTTRTCANWTIRYYRNGRPFQEPTKFTKKGQAERLLKLREGAIAQGVPVDPSLFRVTFDEAAQTVIDDYKVNGKKSRAVVERRITKHLKPYFSGRRLTDISSAHVLAYVAERQRQGIVNKRGVRVADVSNAEINRELQILKRCFSLAMEHGRIFSRPAIKLLQEAPARAGFLDRAQVDAICGHLSPALAAVVRFAFITGWRLHSEVLPLQWHQVDLKAGVVRLEPGSTKNGEGREFKFTTALRELLEARDAAREQLKAKGVIVPDVFFRLVAKGRRGPTAPKPITSIRKAWDRACALAGCPGRIPHDLRRSAVRAFVRAGVSQHVAMQLSGHRTPSVFRRYNITSDADLQDAAAKLDAANQDSSLTATSKRGRGARSFKRIS